MGVGERFSALEICIYGACLQTKGLCLYRRLVNVTGTHSIYNYYQSVDQVLIEIWG